MNEQFVEKIISEYERKRDKYKSFSFQVSSILETMIEDTYPDIKIASYSYRAKAVDSLKRKLRKDKYNENSEITDLAGVRITTYSRKDIQLISNIIKDNFLIDENNSIDKTSSLGNDKVGYRGLHYVVSYTSDRLKMPEYKKYEGMKCEIQITSLIAHTWSEITHEKGYKFEGTLPKTIERRKNLLAGLLELADMEMDEYVQSFDDYINKLSNDIPQGELDLEINSMSLDKYMHLKFPDIEPHIFRDIDMILEELKLFGLENINQLDKLIKSDYEQEIKNTPWRSLDGIIRNILILSNAEKYFSKAWNPSMNRMNKKNYDLYKKFNINIDEICERKNITII